jgi:hypothetical protein
LSSSAEASRGRSYLKGSRNKMQRQGQRSLKHGGLAYQIDFAAADPDLYNPLEVPYAATFPKDKLIIGRGNGEASIPSAKFNDGSSTGRDLLNLKHAGAGISLAKNDVKVESLMPETLYLGQIVPFEIKISVTGLEAPEDGNITFTAGWSTETTSRGDFGYDAKIGVLAAFVDTADGAHNDAGVEASVSFFSWSIVNGDEIQGVFNVTGLDDGDEVVVEVWVVVSSTFPSAGATGNVHSRLIDATTSQDDAINTGTQTIPMMKKGGGSELRFATAPSSEGTTTVISAVSSSVNLAENSDEATPADELKYLC